MRTPAAWQWSLALVDIGIEQPQRIHSLVLWRIGAGCWGRVLATTSDPRRRSLGAAAGGVTGEHVVAEVTAVVAVKMASATR